MMPISAVDVLSIAQGQQSGFEQLEIAWFLVVLALARALQLFFLVYEGCRCTRNLALCFAP